MAAPLPGCTRPAPALLRPAAAACAAMLLVFAGPLPLRAQIPAPSDTPSPAAPAKPAPARPAPANPIAAKPAPARALPGAAIGEAGAPVREPAAKPRPAPAKPRPAAAKQVRAERAAPPPPALVPVGAIDPDLAENARPLVGRPSALTPPETDSARKVASEPVEGRVGLMFDPLSWSPSSIAVFDAGIASLELADAAPVALNSFDSVQAGQPAGPYRAGFIEDLEAGAERLKVTTGTVVWQVSKERAPGGGPAAITADVTVPKLSLKARFTVRPESAGAQSPLAVELTLTAPGVKALQIGAPEMRLTGADRGVPIYARASGGPETFVITLSDARSDGDQNMRLLVERPWIDIPLRLSSGRRAVLAFEKGAIVRDTLRAAFRDWRLPWQP